MSKFKIGDTIRRTGSPLESIAQFDTVTVSCLEHNDRWLGVAEYSSPSGDNAPFLASNFELVQAASEQPAVLTPLEVAEAMLAGAELQFKRHGSTVWRDLTTRKHVVHFNIIHEYRKKPTTVLINGISVPAPLTTTPSTGRFYSINLTINKVYYLDVQYHSAARNALLWSTEAEAQEVLDAIMTSFSK